MRKIKALQLQLGEIAIENVRFDPNSRDDILALLSGLRYIHTNPKRQKELFCILETHLLPGVNLKVGRPGMDMWRVLQVACKSRLSVSQFRPLPMNKRSRISVPASTRTR